MKIPTRTLVFLISLLVSASARAQLDLPYKLAIKPAPREMQAFDGKGQKHLVYELYVTNFEKKPLRLQSLEIEESWPGGKRSLRKFPQEELVKMYSSVAGELTRPQDPLLPPGQAGILYVYLSYPSGKGVPQSLINKLSASPEGGGEPIKQMASPSMAVSPKPAPSLSSPLKGRNWFTPNGPSNISTHRRVALPISGRVCIPERFAVDWIQLGEKGWSYQGDPQRNESYYAYREPVSAVGAGKVVAVKDGIPENTPASKSLAVPITLDTIGGNYVIQELAPGVYAFYAHLIPGSLKAKVGDVLKAGDEIGLLGNSGNSTEPHLHFQLMDHSSPLEAEGLPFELKSFTRASYDSKLDENQDFTYFKIKGSRPVQNEAFMDFDLGDL